jgi:hypothetical protein
VVKVGAASPMMDVIAGVAAVAVDVAAGCPRRPKSLWTRWTSVFWCQLYAAVYGGVPTWLLLLKMFLLLLDFGYSEDLWMVMEIMWEADAVVGGFEIAVAVHYPCIVCLRTPGYHNECYRTQTSRARRGVKTK